MNCHGYAISLNKLHIHDLSLNPRQEAVNKVAREHCLNAPKLMQHVILLLLYADHVVHFSYDVDSMQHLLGVLKEFCHSSGLAMNV